MEQITHKTESQMLEEMHQLREKLIAKAKPVLGYWTQRVLTEAAA